MRKTLNAILAAVLAGAPLAVPGASWAQGAGPTQDEQAAGDQQVDLALGTLETVPSLHALLQVPIRLGTRGPQPFDQQPPAAQSDHGDVTVPVNPRGPTGGKP